MSEDRSRWGSAPEGVASEEALEVRAEELHEFLTADLSGVTADPEFKERLRAKLWEMLTSGHFSSEKPKS